jgi:hypothetical protein
MSATYSSGEKFTPLTALVLSAPNLTGEASALANISTFALTKVNKKRQAPSGVEYVATRQYMNVSFTKALLFGSFHLLITILWPPDFRWLWPLCSAGPKLCMSNLINYLT